jgi:hypothetical protein
MVKMKLIKVMTLVSTAMILSSCGGSASEEERILRFASNNNLIITHDVIGTGVDVATDVAPIDANTNSGNFSLEWSLYDQSKRYKMNAYVSENETLSNSDPQFLEFTCSTTSGACNTADPFQLSCSFDTSNNIDCAGNALEPVDLTSFLSSLPINAYILLESCDFDGLLCHAVQVHEVQFH